MKGRKPTGARLRVLRGNPSKRPFDPDREPRPGALALACPAELLDNEVAAQEWSRTIAPACRSGQITAAERALAIAHCELWAAWRAQLGEARLSKTQVVRLGRSRYPMPNPALSMASKTLQVLLKIDIELGLTPTARARVKVPAPAKRTTDKTREKYFGTSGG